MRDGFAIATFWPNRQQSFHNRTPGSRIRLDANAIIDGRSNPLFAPKIALRRLNRNVPQEELDLLQLANRSNVASLTDQVNNGPMLFALLEMIQSQRHGFMPPQAAREQQCEQSSVAFSFQSLMVRCLPKCANCRGALPISLRL
jgi:hypothetical protein